MRRKCVYVVGAIRCHKIMVKPWGIQVPIDGEDPSDIRTARKQARDVRQCHRATDSALVRVERDDFSAVVGHVYASEPGNFIRGGITVFSQSRTDSSLGRA